MERIILNWHELQAYFAVAETNCTVDCRSRVRMTKYFLYNRINFLGIHFALPIIQEFESMNALFQSTDCDPEKLFQDLSYHHRALYERLFDQNGKEKALSQVEFGAKFLSESEHYLSEFK